MIKQTVKLVFRSKEKQHHIKLIKDSFFGDDNGHGCFGKDKKRYRFVLKKGINNLYEPIRDETLKYFEENNITWWGDDAKYFTGHMKSLDNYESSVYYFEPFYQLMSQTLWVEQMIINKGTERIKADHYLHIHVVPKANIDLLRKTHKVSNQKMEATWRSMLNDQSKYKIINPPTLMNPIKNRYPELYNYPFGVLDFDDNINYRSEELLTRIVTVKPRLHLFGHIHSQYGMKILDNTTFSNGTIMNAYYSNLRRPNLIELL